MKKFNFYINTKDFTIKYLSEKPDEDNWEEISDKQYMLYVGVVNRYAPLRNKIDNEKLTHLLLVGK